MASMVRLASMRFKTEAERKVVDGDQPRRAFKQRGLRIQAFFVAIAPAPLSKWIVARLLGLLNGNLATGKRFGANISKAQNSWTFPIEALAYLGCQELAAKSFCMIRPTNHHNEHKALRAHLRTGLPLLDWSTY